MKIYYFYNQKFSRIVRMFESSMKDDFKLKPIEVDNDIHFGKNLWLLKPKLIVDAIKENIRNEGIIVFSDVDILFFDRVIPIIKEHIKGKEILFQREHGWTGDPKDFWKHNCPLGHDGVNIGFIAIRCNHRSLSFWEKVCFAVKHTATWDQEVVNFLLKINTMSRTNNQEQLSQFVSDDWLNKNKKHDPDITHFLASTYGEVDFDDELLQIKHPLWIGKEELSWGCFPPQIWAWSHGDIKPDICLAHANLYGGDPPQWKITMLNQFKERRQLLRDKEED